MSPVSSMIVAFNVRSNAAATDSIVTQDAIEEGPAPLEGSGTCLIRSIGVEVFVGSTLRQSSSRRGGSRAPVPRYFSIDNHKIWAMA